VLVRLASAAEALARRRREGKAPRQLPRALKFRSTSSARLHALDVVEDLRLSRHTRSAPDGGARAVVSTSSPSLASRSNEPATVIAAADANDLTTNDR
jgi:hypothetical protein